MPTVCPNPKCAQPGHFDSLVHLLSCYDLKLAVGGEEEMVDFLVQMARVASTQNPGRPTPAGSAFEMELQLEEIQSGMQMQAQTRVLSWDPQEVMAALAGSGEGEPEAEPNAECQGDAVLGNEGRWQFLGTQDLSPRI